MHLLLINPPIYDLRFDWSRWHQPCGLLQVGSLLRQEGNDVRLIDCLQSFDGKRVTRKKKDSFSEHNLPRWHYGLTWDQIEQRIQELKEGNWKPNAIYVTCMTTFWWESTRDLIERLREWYPKTRIFLGGVYLRVCPEHAKKNIQGVHLNLEISNRAKHRATDFSLYTQAPQFAGLFFSRTRSARQVVKEIEDKVTLGVREFAFFDDIISEENAKQFEQVLDLIIQSEMDIKLRALGNLSPRALTKSLARKMKQAGYRQIFLRDDTENNDEANKDFAAYEKAVEMLHKYAGYKERTEDLTAMVVVGRPEEKLEQVAERLTRLAHTVGSVNLVPYQPSPNTPIYERYKDYLDEIPLELQNGKLFPFAKLNHASFADYQELIRLAALLNSKFHSTTFDFAGDDPIAGMVRESIAGQLWQPKIKESLPLSPK